MTTQLSHSGQNGLIAEGTSNYLLIALSLIAGISDVTNWLTLGGLFSAHITGNLVIVMADWVRGESPHAIQILAIPVFVIGVVLADFSVRFFGARKGVMTRSLLFE